MSLTEIILSVTMSAFILFGCFLIFAGLLGLLRFPDIYCRIHACAKGPTLGIMFIMIASIIFFATVGGHESFFYSRNVLIMVFILISNPVGVHMLAKNAYRSGNKLWEKSVQDDFQGNE